MILVTGGTGLVGSHLLYHLSLQNDTIRAVYRTESSLEKVKNVFSFYTDDKNLFDKIEWFLADITNVPSMIPAFFDVTHVYHCAAFISFNPKDYRKMRKVNIHGTARDLCTEEDEWNKELNNSGYSITKFGAEMEIWRASQEDVDVVIVNPGVILGSGFWTAGSGKLFSQVYNGFQFYTEGITGFVSVQDVVKPMILLMNSDVKNERFILVSQNKSFKEIFFLIADAFGKKRPSKKIKSWQTNIFWRVAWLLSKITGKEPLLSKYSARSAHAVSKYSSEKIEKTVNFKFENIDKSVEEICKNYLKEHSLP
jgi:dihydroflavonol-4-reductase